MVKMDGSGRISRRRRNFLKAVKIYNPNTISEDRGQLIDKDSASQNEDDIVGPRRSSRLKGGVGDQRES